MEIELKKTLIALFATASVFAGVSAASAAPGASGTPETSTGNLTVRATLKEGCTINFGNGQGSTIEFGNISALAKPMTQESTFNVSCSSLAGQTNTYSATSVALNQGDAANSKVTARLLSNGTDSIGFNVYQDANLQTIWGDDSDPTAKSYPLTGITNGKGQDYPFWVSLHAQDLSKDHAGLYQNTMVATVNYTSNSSGGGQ